MKPGTLLAIAAAALAVVLVWRVKNQDVKATFSRVGAKVGLTKTGIQAQKFDRKFKTGNVAQPSQGAQ